MHGSSAHEGDWNVGMMKWIAEGWGRNDRNDWFVRIP